MPRRLTKQRILQSKQSSCLQDTRALNSRPSNSPIYSSVYSPISLSRVPTPPSPLRSPSRFSPSHFSPSRFSPFHFPASPPVPPHSPSAPPRRQIGAVFLPDSAARTKLAQRWAKINSISSNYQTTSSPIPFYQKHFTWIPYPPPLF